MNHNRTWSYADFLVGGVREFRGCQGAEDAEIDTPGARTLWLHHCQCGCSLVIRDESPSAERKFPSSYIADQITATRLAK